MYVKYSSYGLVRSKKLIDDNYYNVSELKLQIELVLFCFLQGVRLCVLECCGGQSSVSSFNFLIDLNSPVDETFW